MLRRALRLPAPPPDPDPAPAPDPAPDPAPVPEGPLHSPTTPAVLVLLLLLTLLTACAHRGRPPHAVTAPVGEVEKGLASWYGEPYHGRRTASGEIYDMHAMTAAHRTHPFGTLVSVRRTDDGREVEVRINDRGPFIRGRIIDLSYAAARRIGLDVDGLAPVRVEVIGVSHASPPRPSSAAEPAPTHPQPAATDCLWVQVGAFSDEANALRARDRLRGAGENAIIIEGPGGLHRVRLGPFSAAADAEAALARVRPDWPPAQIVACGS